MAQQHLPQPPQPLQPPQARRRWPRGSTSLSQTYLSVSLAVTLILLTAISVSLFTHFGGWPPGFMRSHLISVAVATTAPTRTDANLLHVYALGDVRVPAAYTLPLGSHVRDLIAVAGGAHSTADLQRINPDAALTDGQAIYVPALDEVLPPQRNGKLDLNAATPDQFRRALGITVTVGRQIVAYRDKHGNFTAVNQLLLVPVTRVTYDRIKDLVAI